MLRPYYDYNENDDYPLLLYLPMIFLAIPLVVFVFIGSGVRTIADKLHKKGG